MDDLKPRIRAVLSRHEGRSKAITRRELLIALGRHDDRGMRIAIRELIAEGLPIVSHADPPAGYFLPLTHTELQEGCATIKSYLIEEARRLRDLKKSGALYLAPAYQPKMEL